ncbi:hypothetical protein ABFX02_11G015700 [Erythranthe guttata]
MALHNIDVIPHQLPFDTHEIFEVCVYSTMVRTTVTRAPEIVSQWISDVVSANNSRRIGKLLVSVCVEWRPSFNPSTNNPPAATLQLCVGRSCLVYHLNPIHISGGGGPTIPSSLVNFLANPNHTFVGIGVEQDVENLKRCYSIGYGMKAVDLRNLAAARYGMRELVSGGLNDVATMTVGMDVRKPEGFSLMENQWITPNVLFACIDSFVCFEIGHFLNASA